MKEVVGRLFHRIRPARATADTAVAQSVASDLVGQHTGFTVFDDVALRLRNLTVENLDPLHGDPGSIPGAFKIRIARNRDKPAGDLVERRYVSRGYSVPLAAADLHLRTFVAYDEGQLVGTVAIRLDSATGLAADALYRREIDLLRTTGRVCEFTRLAVDVKAVSKAVLAGLFHTAYLYAARVRGFDVAVVEVNPRHVAFYKRALGFEPMGEERLNERVNAPAVLLGVPFARVAEELDQYAGRPELASRSHSLFPYGFPRTEAEGILRRLLALHQVPSGST